MSHHKVAAAFIFVFITAAAATTAYVNAQAPKFRQDVTVQGREALTGRTSDHFLTFSQPFSLPGTSFGAGTYVFRSPVPGVIQVFGERGMPYAQVTTVPIVRTGWGNGYEASFESQGPGAPPRLVAIWMAGQHTGQEVIYNK